MLGGPGDAGGDVDLRLYRLARLSDLVGVGHPTGIDDGPRRTGRTVKGLREVFDHRVLAGLTESTTTGDDDSGFVELRSGALLHVTFGDGGRPRGAAIGYSDGLDGGRRSTRCLGGVALRTHEHDERPGAGEAGFHDLRSAEDGVIGDKRVAGNGDADRIGEHRAVELDGKTAGDVAAVVGLCQKDRVGRVARADKCGDRRSHGHPEERPTEVSGGIDLRCSVAAELGRNGRAVTRDNGFNRGSGFPGRGEELERAGGDVSVDDLCNNPNL